MLSAFFPAGPDRSVAAIRNGVRFESDEDAG